MGCRASAHRLTDHSFEQGFDLTGQVLGLGGRCKTLDHLTVLADQELGEIPLNAFGPQYTGRPLLELDKQRMGIGTVDLDFLEQWKTHTEVKLAELGDRHPVARLLLAKLVAGKAHNTALVLKLGST